MKFELNTHTIYVLLIIGICVLGYLFLYRNNPKYTKYDIEISKMEERIKSLEKELIEKDSIYNVLERQRDSTLNVIKKRDKTIKNIIKNYDKKILDITNLSNDSTIGFFKDWIKSE